jgi:superoxide reductase
MARIFSVYKCSVCGNIVVLMHSGGGTLVCCEHPMNLLKAGENETAAKEKHIPVVTQDGDFVEVAVGSVAHPMTPEHLIEWIAVVTDTQVYTQYLSPGDAPAAAFTLPAGTKDFDVYEYCNLHGLWKA